MLIFSGLDYVIARPPASRLVVIVVLVGTLNVLVVTTSRVLAADVLAKKDVAIAIADHAEWRGDERRRVREDKLPQPGWWPE